jgi:VanZ family protein
VSRRAGRWWPAVFTLAVLGQSVVLYAPSSPGLVQTGLPVDKLVHFGVFFAVAAAGVLAEVPRPVLLILLAGQAVGSELLQSAVLPQRSGDPWDVLADLAGAAAGWWAGGRWAARPGRGAPGSATDPVGPGVNLEDAPESAAPSSDRSDP